MFSSHLQAAVEILSASGLNGEIKAIRGPGRTASISYRLRTDSGTIEVSMVFYGSRIHTTAFRLDPLVEDLHRSHPLTVEGAREAASEIVKKLRNPSRDRRGR
jgi:hypothetical protein